MDQQYNGYSPKFQSEVAQNLINDLNRSQLEKIQQKSLSRELSVNKSVEYHRIISKKMKILKQNELNNDIMVRNEEILEYLNLDLTFY